VLKESETHIFIAGKPIQRKHAMHFSEFKLYLEKNPWRLKAAQYIHPGEIRVPSIPIPISKSIPWNGKNPI